ncbi:MAG: RagB/SusD family nutrient uptake outer membrane protein [Bacteroidales bacterium]|nr:RagB/SusD family nutrient uptake outer membrane protein [Bacteroidales bacterium]
MKSIKMKYKLNIFTGSLILLLGLSSCESYLDKAPEATITEKDAYGNFISFQGAVEELYSCITDPNKAGAWNQYLFADETLYNDIYAFDQGNYWSQSGYLYGTSVATTDLNSRTKRVWPLAWYGIRKANLALSKLPLLEGTQEEKDLIKGQALFFRGWFYFELMKWYGGLPYIDTVLAPTADMKIPRLNYRETALRAAADFRAAADLLPEHWDKTVAGQATLGNNGPRINKFFALGYLGRDLLYAASPMMNEESTGSATFDADLCKQAASAFAELLSLNDQTQTYKMQTWATWTDNFWVWSPSNNIMSGGTEVIMNCTVYDKGRVRWSTVGFTCPTQFGGNASKVEVPTANYIKNYAMANGLPIDDPASGYNPANPWTNREPRFYSDIIIDGDKMTASSGAGVDQYAQLYTGGRHRSATNGSVTGFYYKRYSPFGCNQWDKKWDAFQAYVPFLRLADIYLMYSEAVLQGYGSASATAPGYSLTAEGAINVVRNRAKLPNISATYTGSKDAFMGEIIRERAVELAYEGERFQDLRRWNLNTELKYREKTAVEFDRDPVTKKPINITERVVITRVAEKKHNWLPFQVKFTKQYEGFQQNPGW